MSEKTVSITQMNDVLEDMTASMKSGCYHNDTDSDATTVVPQTIVITPHLQRENNNRSRLPAITRRSQRQIPEKV